MARYEPDDPAFAGDFIEFSDSWSRAQVRKTWAALPVVAERADHGTEDALLQCLRPKIVALHLTCIDAPPITEADELTPERTEAMDMRLYQWFAYVWPKHLNTLTELGNALGRRLLATSVGTAKPTARKSRKN